MRAQRSVRLFIQFPPDVAGADQRSGEVGATGRLFIQFPPDVAGVDKEKATCQWYPPLHSIPPGRCGSARLRPSIHADSRAVTRALLGLKMFDSTSGRIRLRKMFPGGRLAVCERALGATPALPRSRGVKERSHPNGGRMMVGGTWPVAMESLSKPKRKPECRRQPRYTTTTRERVV